MLGHAKGTLPVGFQEYYYLSNRQRCLETQGIPEVLLKPKDTGTYPGEFPVQYHS